LSFYSRWIFPYLMDVAMQDSLFTRHRKGLLLDVMGDVLEIGVGTGLNLRHYPEEVNRLDVVDSNPGMNRLLRRRMKDIPFPVLHATISAETLPYSDGQFDMVVSTWTLCSIPDVSKALSEIYRVLKPGGQFRYVEHGLAPDANVAKWQHRLNGFQNVIADGCHLNRDIMELIHSAGFELSRTQNAYTPKAPRFVGYHYTGIALKP